MMIIMQKNASDADTINSTADAPSPTREPRGSGLDAHPSVVLRRLKLTGRRSILDRFAACFPR